MREYFFELGLGLIVYLFFVFPIISMLIGVFLFIFSKKIWTGSVISFFIFLLFWWIINFDIRSYLPITVFYSLLSLFSSWLFYKLKRNKKGKEFIKKKINF